MKKEKKKETISGDIRRIRKILKVCDPKNRTVMCDYVSLLKLFEAIETKARAMENEIEEFKKKL